METLTLKEAAPILKIKRDAIYKLVRTGIIPAIRVGNAWRIVVSKLQEWIDNGGKTLQENPAPKEKKA
jgi:excisionase family DNA binding protein